MDLVIHRRTVPFPARERRLAAIGAQLLARAKRLWAAISGPLSPTVQALERRRERQKAFSAFDLGGKGFF